ncbi:MAG: hypothetical protein EBW12_05525 [Actinobacteria bacterium]|jgi:hypothetical protein|nr:hypothetical protein [Actinomycetota bacterium]
MAYSVSHIIGADFNSTVPTNANSAGTAVPIIGPLGLEAFGSDGRLYVLAQANASIPASTAVCTVNSSTFLVTASGGSYTSPAVALVSGDVAWFSKASV